MLYRRTKTDKGHMFSGLVYCADCGAKMRYCTTSYFEKRQNHFVCANYRSNTGSCSAHFIRAVVLEEMVWAHMEEVISYVTRYEAHFRAAMEERLKLVTSEAIKTRRKKPAQNELEVQERQVENLEQFIQRVHKYAGLDGLTAYAMHKLIKGIYIEAPDKSSGHRVEGIRIVYDLVGFLPLDKLTKEETE